MSDTMALVVALPGILAALLSLRNGWKVDKVHNQINSRLDELLAEARRVADAIGYQRGVMEERKRVGKEKEK